jgi:hypothetical protein
VALLTPLPDTTPLERLRAAGEVEGAKASFADIPPPLPLLCRPSASSRKRSADPGMASASKARATSA